MPDTPSITINKRFTYQGVGETWSNTYHFSGTTPTTDTAWAALGEAIFAAEKPMFGPDVRYVGYLGYNAGNEHAVSIKDYVADGTTQPTGTATVSGGVMPGDVAFWVRWATPNRTSRGKRIYLRKYFHGIPPNADAPSAGLKASALTYGAKMIDGSLPGGFKVCGPQGAEASAPFAAPYFTTRTLKRRGKRPSR